MKAKSGQVMTETFNSKVYELGYLQNLHNSHSNFQRFCISIQGKNYLIPAISFKTRLGVNAARSLQQQ